MLECSIKLIKRPFYIKIKFLFKEETYNHLLDIINYHTKIGRKANIKGIYTNIYLKKLPLNKSFIKQKEPLHRLPRPLKDN